MNTGSTPDYLIVCLPKELDELDLNSRGETEQTTSLPIAIARRHSSSSSKAELCGLGVSVRTDEYRSWLTNENVYSCPELQLVTSANVVYTLLPALLKNNSHFVPLESLVAESDDLDALARKVSPDQLDLLHAKFATQLQSVCDVVPMGSAGPKSKKGTNQEKDASAFRLNRVKLRDWLVAKVRRLAAHLQPTIRALLERSAQKPSDDTLQASLDSRANARSIEESLRIFARYVPDELLEELVRETSIGETQANDAAEQSDLRGAIAAAQSQSKVQPRPVVKKSKTSAALEKDARDSKKITSFFTKK